PDAAQAAVGFQQGGARSGAGGGEGGGDAGRTGAADDDVGVSLDGNVAGGFVPAGGSGGFHGITLNADEDGLEITGVVLSMITWLRNTPWRMWRGRPACTRRRSRWRCATKGGFPRRRGGASVNWPKRWAIGRIRWCRR